MVLYWTLKLLAMYGAANLTGRSFQAMGVRSNIGLLILILVAANVVAILFDVSLTPTHTVAFVKVTP